MFHWPRARHRSLHMLALKGIVRKYASNWPDIELPVFLAGFVRLVGARLYGITEIQYSTVDKNKVVGWANKSNQVDAASLRAYITADNATGRLRKCNTMQWCYGQIRTIAIYYKVSNTKKEWTDYFIKTKIHVQIVLHLQLRLLTVPFKQNIYYLFN